MNMKKMIAILLALVLCVSVLAGCGDSAEKQRREAAKEIFGITDQEYKKNSEYYDALMNDYSDFTDYEPDYQTDAGYDYDSGSKPGSAIRDPNDPRLDGISLEEAYERRSRENTNYAVKKGDLFYGIDDSIFEDLSFTTGVKYGGFAFVKNSFDTQYRIITDTMWEYPDISQAAGDQIVAFSREGSYKTLRFQPYEMLFTGFPVLCAVDSNGKIDLYDVDEDYVQFTSADGNNDEFDGFDLDEVMIDGVPFLESPRLVFLYEYKGEMYYGFRGEPEEIVTMSYKWTTSYYERRCFCNVEYVVESGDEIQLEPQPTVNGMYSPLAREGGAHIEPGTYVLYSWPVRVVD